MTYIYLTIAGALIAIASIIGIGAVMCAGMAERLQRRYWICSWCGSYFCDDHKPRLMRPIGKMQGHGMCEDCNRREMQDIHRNQERRQRNTEVLKEAAGCVVFAAIVAGALLIS